MHATSLNELKRRSLSYQHLIGILAKSKGTYQRMARTFAKNSSKRTQQGSRGRPHTSHARPVNSGKPTATKSNCSAARPRPNTPDNSMDSSVDTTPPAPATVTPYTPTNPDHLSNYFRSMSSHALLSPEQERDMAYRIEWNEVATWLTLLSNPSVAEYLVDYLEARLPEPVSEFAAVRQTAAAARKTRSKLRRGKLADAAQQASEQVRGQDKDRIHIDAVLVHLHDLSVSAPSTRGTKLSFSPRSRSYTECLQAAFTYDRVAVRLRRDFVHANLRLVVTMARRYDQGGMSLADLIQEGNLGLMHAVSRFDYNRGLRFSTYACWWIRHAIGRALADKSRTVRIPVHMLEAQARLNKVQVKLSRDLHRRPTVKELAQAASMPLGKIEQMHRYLMGSQVSLDKPSSDHDDRPFGDLLTDPESELSTAEDRLTAQSMANRVYALMDELSPLEAEVIRQRFGLRDDNQRTFREIGDQYHLSRERIRQIQNRALGKLREALANTM